MRTAASSIQGRQGGVVGEGCARGVVHHHHVVVLGRGGPRRVLLDYQVRPSGCGKISAEIRIKVATYAADKRSPT